jgi:hypothetical protein
VFLFERRNWWHRHLACDSPSEIFTVTAHVFESNHGPKLIKKDIIVIPNKNETSSDETG